MTSRNTGTDIHSDTTDSRRPEDLGSFVRENKDLLKQYLETRFDILRLKALLAGSRAAGVLAWLFVVMLLVGLVFVFAGMTLGFWLSNVLESPVWGFGVTTLLFILLLALLALFRKALFINPVSRLILAISRGGEAAGTGQAGGESGPGDDPEYQES